MTTATKATHTPGPWKVGFRADSQYDDDKNGRPVRNPHTVWVAIEGAQRTSIATVNAYKHNHGAGLTHKGRREQDEVEANARLIAAAPEMLEALEELLQFLPDRNDALNYAATNEGRVGSIHIAVHKAQEAIKKARGEQ